MLIGLLFTSFFLLYWVTFSHGIPPFSCVYLPADCSIYLLFAINVHCCFPLNFFLWAKSPVCVPTSLFSWPSLDFFVSFYYMLAAILFSRFFENFQNILKNINDKIFLLGDWTALSLEKKNQKLTLSSEKILNIKLYFFTQNWLYLDMCIC